MKTFTYRNITFDIAAGPGYGCYNVVTTSKTYGVKKFILRDSFAAEYCNSDSAQDPEEWVINYKTKAKEARRTIYRTFKDSLK